MDRNRYREIIEFAITKEQEAASLYEQYREVVTAAAGKKLLAEMAQMEREHERLLTDILERGDDHLTGKTESVGDLHLSDYLVDIELKKDSPIEDVFIFAMKAEQKAADLYGRLAELQSDSDARELFARLSKEEKKHKLDLESQYDEGIMRWN